MHTSLSPVSAHIRSRERVAEPRGDGPEPGSSVSGSTPAPEACCAECNAYDAGLKAGARAISQAGPRRRHARRARRRHRHPRRPAGSAASGRRGPRPTPASRLKVTAISTRSGPTPPAAAGAKPLAATSPMPRANLSDYFAGNTDRMHWAIDWAFLSHPARPRSDRPNQSPTPDTGPTSTSPTLARLETSAGSWAPTRSPSSRPPVAGARGVEIPTTFVGGSDRRHWLESHETAARDAPPQ